MKIVTLQDRRPYVGSPKEIVEKLRRDAIHMQTANLDAYIREVAERLQKDGFEEVEIKGDSTEARCESLLQVMIVCDIARPVFD